ncbi:MAG: branched-chain amino acid aminotransferase, partial [Flavobacteriaceae bacterium]
MDATVKNLTIEKAKTSKIDQVDFQNLSFGTVFTDHMFICEYKGGMWHTPSIV